MTDTEKVAVFDRYLSQMPWWGHATYCLTELKPTLFNRMFRWKTLEKWLSVSQRVQDDQNLMMSIANDMGYNYHR